MLEEQVQAALENPMAPAHVVLTYKAIIADASAGTPLLQSAIQDMAQKNPPLLKATILAMGGLSSWHTERVGRTIAQLLPFAAEAEKAKQVAEATLGIDMSHSIVEAIRPTDDAQSVYGDMESIIVLDFCRRDNGKRLPAIARVVIYAESQ
jgi:hypothetical protein